MYKVVLISGCGYPPALLFPPQGRVTSSQRREEVEIPTAGKSIPKTGDAGHEKPG